MRTQHKNRRQRAKGGGNDSHLIQLINQQLRMSRPPAEVKTYSSDTAAQNIGSYLSTAFSGSGVPLTPYTGSLSITQGVGQGSRIGNRIEIRKLRFRGSIRPRTYNVTTNPTPCPQYVRLLIVTDEDNPNTFPLPGNDFFQLGSSSAPPDGTISDIYRDVNKDRWTVYHDQVFKVGVAAAGGTGVQVAAQSYTNNDFKLVEDFDIDVGRLAPKSYDFDDNSTQPKTRCLAAYFFCCTYDGFVTTSAIVPCNLAFHLTMDFTDA